ncbi:MAG: four helix bundle protein [Leadbetterella sp.]|jgi:four helix bundle protein|nr:four helix bundle protein [Leadbetterella sp.]
MTRFQLQDRLIDFSVLAIDVVDGLISSKAGNHLGGQLVRSATSCPLNYGEAQSAESSKDFVHKMSVVLKELRETWVCLEIIRKAKLTPNSNQLTTISKENNELISIFVKSIETSKNKSQLKKS